MTGPAAVAAVAAATAAATGAAATAVAVSGETEGIGPESEKGNKESRPVRTLPMMATNLSLREQTIGSALTNAHTTTDFE